MKKNNIIENIGLCRKAGKLTLGFDAVIKELPKTAGIITASDISAKTLKELKFHADRQNCSVKVTDATMDEIKRVLNKRVGIMGIMDEGLYKIVSGSTETDKDCE